MTKAMKEAAKGYRLKEASTPEELECSGFKTISYGTETICIGYFYSPDGKCYYAATYDFTDKKKTTCEDECRLKFVTPERYEDEGHALKAEMQYKGY